MDIKELIKNELIKNDLSINENIKELINISNSLNNSINNLKRIYKNDDSAFYIDLDLYNIKYIINNIYALFDKEAELKKMIENK